jgi:hypothetical protein
MVEKHLVLPDIEGYVILECMACKDQFYVKKKKNETAGDAAYYAQFKKCAACHVQKEYIRTPKVKTNPNWDPASWNPTSHDSSRLKQ